MIRYTNSLECITPDQLRGGFFVGWPNPPSLETHLRLLAGSAAVILAVDEATGAVVGFANAISDGVLAAYIPLIEVLPTWQNRGIGTELMQRMLANLQDYYMVDLLCDPDIQPFYARLGMQPASGVFVRNYDRQSGA